jgi:hypothetical protein
VLGRRKIVYDFLGVIIELIFLLITPIAFWGYCTFCDQFRRLARFCQ